MQQDNDDSFVYKPEVPMIGRSGIEKLDPLDDYQDEVADILSEECCELAQAASKLQRCGKGFIPSNGNGNTFENQFAVEVADVLLMIDEAARAGLINYDLLRAALLSKPERLRVWTSRLGHAPVRFANAELLKDPA